MAWCLILCTLLALACTFALFHYVYRNHLLDHIPTPPYRSRLDFLILTIGGLTEPEPLPWFKIMSGGTFIASSPDYW